MAWDSHGSAPAEGPPDEAALRAKDLIARFRHKPGHFATGVVILTSLHDGEPVGMTAQSFTSVSLEPLLVSLP